jgi:hypothetical protein
MFDILQTLSFKIFYHVQSLISRNDIKSILNFQMAEERAVDRMNAFLHSPPPPPPTMQELMAQ